MFDTAFFDKHQKALLFGVNAPVLGLLVRWLLWIPEYWLPVTKLAPEAVHVWTGFGKRRTTIYSNAQYAEAMHRNFAWLWWSFHFWDWLIADRLVPSLDVGFGTYSSQPDGTAGIDARTRDDTPTTNFATDANLYIGEYAGFTEIHRSWIKFDLSSIATGQQADSGTLSLWQHSEASSNARTLRVYRSIRAWVEAQVTWNNYSTGNAFNTAGGFDALDVDTTDMASRAFSATEASGEKQFTFTDLDKLTDMLPGGSWTNNGWLMKADTEVDDWYAFRSSDYGTAGNRPKLVIEYSEIPSSGSGFFDFF